MLRGSCVRRITRKRKRRTERDRDPSRQASDYTFRVRRQRFACLETSRTALTHNNNNNILHWWLPGSLAATYSYTHALDWKQVCVIYSCLHWPRCMRLDLMHRSGLWGSDLQDTQLMYGAPRSHTHTHKQTSKSAPSPFLLTRSLQLVHSFNFGKS